MLWVEGVHRAHGDAGAMMILGAAEVRRTAQTTLDALETRSVDSGFSHTEVRLGEAPPIVKSAAERLITDYILVCVTFTL